MHGSPVPWILRRASNETQDEEALLLESGLYTLVGSAYVHEIMDGEAMNCVEGSYERALAAVS